MTLRRLVVACALSVTASCGYPEFAFVPTGGGEGPDATIDSNGINDTGDERAGDSDAAPDAQPQIDSSAPDATSSDAGIDVRPETGVDVADTGTDVTLLARGATWRYLDDGTTPGTTWRGGGGFDDSKWKSGAAQFGFGDGDEKTVVTKGAPDGGTQYTTYYFRRFITVTDAASYATVMIRLLRDDGALVYFNGSEVFRSNMPAGTVTNATFASSTINGGAEGVWQTQTVPAATLAEGANVIAVEIHQANLTSSDLGFDIELVGHKP